MTILVAQQDKPTVCLQEAFDADGDEEFEPADPAQPGAKKQKLGSEADKSRNLGKQANSDQEDVDEVQPNRIPSKSFLHEC